MTELKIDFTPDKPGSRKGVVAVYDGSNPLALDTFDIASEDKRQKLVKDIIAAFPHVSGDELGKALLEKATEVISQQGHGDADNADDERTEDPLGAMPQEVVEEAMRMLRSPDLFERILADIERIGVTGEDDLKLAVYVIMTSRLMDKPLSAIVQGASSSGKSYTIETVVKLMPPEGVVMAHDFTDQALYYLPPGSLQHKAVISGERVHDRRGKDGQAEDNTKAFREMVASGILKKAVTVKGPDGVPVTKIIEQPGPIAYLESTTATHINDEDATRLLPLVTDESPEQTRKIMEADCCRAKGAVVSEQARQTIIQRHHAMQRLLKPIAVRIPYAGELMLPTNNVATRRTYRQFLSAITSVALLRQYQKPIQTDAVIGDDYIEADEHDYAVAYRLMQGILARKYSRLDSRVRDTLGVIIERTVKTGADGERYFESFTRADCVGWIGMSEAEVRRRITVLVDTGALSEDGSGKPYKHRVIRSDLAKPFNLGLPTPEAIAERIAIMRECEVRTI